MSNVIAEECYECKYFDRSTVGEYGDCRRYPPKMIAGDKEKGEMDFIPSHPTVYFSEWCGEFQAL